MDNIIKSFQFEAENIKLTLSIKKEVYKGAIKMFIDADVDISRNNNVKKTHSINGTSKDTSLDYKGNTFFWVSTNDWKGMRWDNYSNETKFRTYSTLQDMKESYLELREYIPLIAEYFYNCVNKYKQLKILFETNLDEIMVDDK
jgi:hypothetical protein